MRLASLALLLALVAPQAHGQIIPSVNLGVAGGANFSDFNDIRDVNTEASTGYHIGVYGDVSAFLFSFRTGVYYLNAGNVGAGDCPSGCVETVEADFVTVPVELHLQTPTPVVKAYALAGPELRFPIGEASEGFVNQRSVNVAANVGVGVKGGVPLIGPSGFLELRYAHDVTGYAESAGLDTDNDYKVNLFMIRAGVGI